MTIEYIHASKFGNGARVAEEFKRLMTERGNEVNIHHVRDVKPDSIAPADLYVFSSPARIGKPLLTVRRFLRSLELQQGAKYALLTTQVGPQPDKAGHIPTPEEQARWYRVVPIMDEILQAKGLTKVASEVIYVVDIKGPLEEGWQDAVNALVDRLAQ